MSRAKIETANRILHDAGTRLVRSREDASWATKIALPMWMCVDLERRLEGAGIETSVAIDNDDLSVGWIYCMIGLTDGEGSEIEE